MEDDPKPGALLGRMSFRRGSAQPRSIFEWRGKRVR